MEHTIRPADSKDTYGKGSGGKSLFRQWKNWTEPLIFLMLSLLTVTFVYPFLFLIINALKTRTEYAVSPFSLPSVPSFENLWIMLDQFDILLMFRNTLIVTISSVMMLLVFGIFASYAFAKLQFPMKKTLYLIFITTMFIPGQVTMIPAYVQFARLGLVNNFLSVILTYAAGSMPGALLLLVSNFRGISGELIESATLDGCGYFQMIARIVVPLGYPAIAILIIFQFMGFWNDLFTPMILLQKMDMRTVMVALSALMGRTQSDPTFQLSGLLLSTAPTLAVYLLFQKQIVKGLTMGSFR